MTFNLRTFALAALVAIASLSQTMHAQTSPVDARVNVPFSFDYGTAHFGSGTYIISMNGPDTLVVRNRVSSQSAMALAQLSSEPNLTQSGVVTFRKYGDRYFLVEVSIAGSGDHISVWESKAEKRAARELASRGAEPTQLAVAILPTFYSGN